MNINDYGLVPNTDTLSGIPARVMAVHKERYEIVCEYGLQSKAAGTVSDPCVAKGIRRSGNGANY